MLAPSHAAPKAVNERCSYIVEDIKSFHAAILQFLILRFPKTAQTFSSESGVTSADLNRIVKTEELLQKKWLATSKLQMSLMAHEKQMASKDLRLEVLEGLFGLRKSQTVKIPSSIKSRVESYKVKKSEIMCMSPQAPCFATSSSSNGHHIEIWGLDSLNEAVLERIVPISGTCSAMAFDPLGRTLLVASGTNVLEVFAVKDWVLTSKIKTAGTTILRVHMVIHRAANPFRFQFSYNTILITRDLSVQLWDVEKGVCIKTTSWSSKAHLKSTCVVASKYLCLGLDDGKFVSFILHDDEVEHGQEVQAHDRCIESLVAIDTDDMSRKFRMASSGRDSVIKIWNLENATCLMELKGHHDWVRHLGVHPLGTILVSAGDDRTLKFWDIEKGQLRHNIQEAHPIGICGVAFMCTGNVLCSFTDKIPLLSWSCDLDPNGSPLESMFKDASETLMTKQTTQATDNGASQINSESSSILATPVESRASLTKEEFQDSFLQTLSASGASIATGSDKSKIQPTKKSATPGFHQRRRTVQKNSGEMSASPGASRLASLLHDNSATKSQAPEPSSATSEKRGSGFLGDLKLSGKKPSVARGDLTMKRVESAKAPIEVQSARAQPKAHPQVSPRGPIPTARRDSMPFISTTGLRRSSTVNSTNRAPLKLASTETSKVVPVFELPPMAEAESGQALVKAASLEQEKLKSKLESDQVSVDMKKAPLLKTEQEGASSTDLISPESVPSEALPASAPAATELPKVNSTDRLIAKQEVPLGDDKPTAKVPFSTDSISSSRTTEQNPFTLVVHNSVSSRPIKDQQPATRPSAGGVSRPSNPSFSGAGKPRQLPTTAASAAGSTSGTNTGTRTNSSSGKRSCKTTATGSSPPVVKQATSSSSTRPSAPPISAVPAKTASASAMPKASPASVKTLGSPASTLKSSPPPTGHKLPAPTQKASSQSSKSATTAGAVPSKSSPKANAVPQKGSTSKCSPAHGSVAPSTQKPSGFAAARTGQPSGGSGGRASPGVRPTPQSTQAVSSKTTQKPSSSSPAPVPLAAASINKT
eukprot:Gregarina_sp_Poly_1__9742@NODE_61_length_16710_cov_172_464520_g52_i0_p2_GENE_NODE_61_length_16710_cov_172_464520_g52_i0NODE_61_length_16710_cov_172_464520_g52_i0_p2_ORF_typecomplete_len1047_score164_90ANAPC4_WD40/PF12894_7/0_028ANAPC4_WD40/PF12894_7/11ANAPC4_WD40/PF12894_7/4_9e10ANAPC4_WD40/PF12894_7/3_9e03WD40/PF00400_32/1_8e02WD40/PF00400_32/4_8WD40/PF00400_32/7_2e09WD40/PF00400_32/1_8e04WD40/PF00400_32/7_1e02eIF2A/PF08662_11/0_13eIF2A/PF08662_11/0_0071Nup160/PF11715_8/10Nup160/PF11715_8/0_015